jgi:hypothetical protein
MKAQELMLCFPTYREINSFGKFLNVEITRLPAWASKTGASEAADFYYCDGKEFFPPSSSNRRLARALPVRSCK